MVTMDVCCQSLTMWPYESTSSSLRISGDAAGSHQSATDNRIISLKGLFLHFLEMPPLSTSLPLCCYLYTPFPPCSSDERLLTTIALFPERTASYISPALILWFSLFAPVTGLGEACLGVPREGCSCREGSGRAAMGLLPSLGVSLNAALCLGLLGGLGWKRDKRAAQQGDSDWIDVVN